MTGEIDLSQLGKPLFVITNYPWLTDLASVLDGLLRMLFVEIWINEMSKHIYNLYYYVLLFLTVKYVDGA